MPDKSIGHALFLLVHLEAGSKQMDVNLLSTCNDMGFYKKGGFTYQQALWINVMKIEFVSRDSHCPQAVFFCCENGRKIQHKPKAPVERCK